MKLKYFLLLATIFCTNLHSQQALSAGLEDEIGGLVIDRTITRFGKDFYQSFSALWRDIKGTQKYTLAIIEKPLPQSGTVLWIELQGKKIYQTYFGRRKSQNNENIEMQAIQIVSNQIVNMMQQEHNPDFKGDGYE